VARGTDAGTLDGGNDGPPQPGTYVGSIADAQPCDEVCASTRVVFGCSDRPPETTTLDGVVYSRTFYQCARIFDPGGLVDDVGEVIEFDGV
jgi:hypothetical protein